MLKFMVELMGYSKTSDVEMVETVMRSWLDPLRAAGNTGWPSGAQFQDCYTAGDDEAGIDGQLRVGEDTVVSVFRAMVIVSP